MPSLHERAREEENRAKNILFDFWRDYQNAPMSEDRDEVIEVHSQRLMAYFQKKRNMEYPSPKKPWGKMKI